MVKLCRQTALACRALSLAFWPFASLISGADEFFVLQSFAPLFWPLQTHTHPNSDGTVISHARLISPPRGPASRRSTSVDVLRLELPITNDIFRPDSRVHRAVCRYAQALSIQLNVRAPSFYTSAA